MKKQITLTIGILILILSLVGYRKQFTAVTAPFETPKLVVETIASVETPKDNLKSGTNIVLCQDVALLKNNKAFDIYINANSEVLEKLELNNDLITIKKGTKVIVTKSNLASTEVDVLDGNDVGSHGVAFTASLRCLFSPKKTPYISLPMAENICGNHSTQ